MRAVRVSHRAPPAPGQAEPAKIRCAARRMCQSLVTKPQRFHLCYACNPPCRRFERIAMRIDRLENPASMQQLNSRCAAILYSTPLVHTGRNIADPRQRSANAASPCRDSKRCKPAIDPAVRTAGQHNHRICAGNSRGRLRQERWRNTRQNPVSHITTASDDSEEAFDHSILLEQPAAA